LDYTAGIWNENYSPKNKDVLTGYTFKGKGFSAKIQKSMSDQLWTTIDRSLLNEIYRIDIA
jgi:hypothetical protein